MSRIVGELPRHAVKTAHEILQDTPLLVVQGARQVGKSTLLRQAIDPAQAVFVTLDDALTREYAQADPPSFVLQAPGKTLVIDEAQRVPQLALALKAAIDADRRPGRFAVSGSADLLRIRGVSDSLAGRAETLHLLPFSQGELAKRDQPEDWVTWILQATSGEEPINHAHRAAANADKIRADVLAGGYPEPLKRETPARADRWFGSYLQSLVAHDAPELAGNTSAYPLHLENLLRLLAAQGQSELVKAKVARSLGISETAVGDYLVLAKTMYLIDELSSWGVGFSGRVVRRPKVSVSDTGLAAFLSGLTVDNARQAGGYELFGATFEAFVVGELRKQETWSSQRYRLFHYRHREEEVDLVIELRDGSLILVEVKSKVSLNRADWKNLESLSARIASRVKAAVVLYLGQQSLQMKMGQTKLLVLPVSTLWDHPDRS